ncbi:hypothetical protein B0O80DRAFT_274098 [Mortierella sp. GBAus27b]|nr:hypothetical protein BGX31_005738 [Mortierella sp. GBA43]KAI8358096.1 hypothetical protein B0O80DRAFT_274098 [Mortierella sp. GBAus27b]
MNETPFQAFRVKSSSRITNIPSRRDPQSGQYVVLWDDIGQYFGNAQGVLNGENAVVFITNDKLERCTPLRIAHHPDAVLDVLVAGSDTKANDSLIDSAPAESVPNCAGNLNSGAASMTRDILSLRITEIPNSNSQALVVHSQCRLAEAQPTDDQSSRPQLAMDSVMDQQEQLRQLNERTQRLEQQVEELQHQIQDTRQQVDDVPNKITHSEQHILEKLQQQIDETLRNIQRRQVYVNETGQGTPLPIGQVRMETLIQHSVIQYRVNMLLRDRSDDIQVPWLFIVLPLDIDIEQEETSPQHFRLHFLCECGAYTITKGIKGTHEVHTTSHSGYVLKRPKEFFDKYGSYVLTMMYLIKYGGMAPGFAVPPLGCSGLVARIEEDQKHLSFAKKNINRLVDTTIAYLENATSSFDNNMASMSQWSSRPADLEELKSYLEVNEGENFPGNIHRLIKEPLCCPWVCSKHQIEWTVQRLKDVVISIGGAYVEDLKRTNIKITSNGAEKRAYDAIVDLCRINCTDDTPSFTIDCGRFSLDISPSCGSWDVVGTIKELGDLTLDDIEVIHQCNLTRLSIDSTPQEADEGRLTDIIRRHSLNLKRLCVTCVGERSLDIINRVISARETILQGGKTAGLHTFELTDQRSRPLNRYGFSDEHDHVAATVTFSEKSTTFDMDTIIWVSKNDLMTEGSMVSNFIRKFGWSISALNAFSRFTDHIAGLLDDTTQTHGSQLTHLTLSPDTLTIPGLEVIDRIIKRSKGLRYLWIHFTSIEEGLQSEKLMLLLGRYGEKLNRLSLISGSVTCWLPQVAQAFPSRNSFPMMDGLAIYCNSRCELSPEHLRWINAMVSATTSPPSLGSSSIDGSSPEVPQQAMKPVTTPQQLTLFQLSNVACSSQDWETLIKTLDFAVLHHLHFNRSNFSLEQLDLMIECISNTDAKSTRLRALGLNDTDLAINGDKDALRVRILKVAPQLESLKL